MNQSTSRASRLKPILIIAIVVAIIAIIVYAYVSPYLALRQLKQAVDARDAQTISAYVDYPALRVSLKQQITGELMHRIDARQRDNPLAILGALVGSALIGPLVDAYATPDGVAALMSGMPPRGQPGEQPPKLDEATPAQAASAAPPVAGAPPDEADEAPPQASAGYRNIDEFVVTYQRNTGDARYAAIFHRDGLFGWKLSAIDLRQ